LKQIYQIKHFEVNYLLEYKKSKLKNQFSEINNNNLNSVHLKQHLKTAENHNIMPFIMLINSKMFLNLSAVIYSYCPCL